MMKMIHQSSNDAMTMMKLKKEKKERIKKKKEKKQKNKEINKKEVKRIETKLFSLYIDNSSFYIYME